MKTTKKQTTAAKALTGYPSFQPIASHSDATKSFIASQPKSKASNGQNTCLAEFLQVAKFIIENMRVFTIQDFYQLSRGKDLAAQDVRELFADWTGKMVADGRLRRMVGIYDHESFEVV